MAYLTLAEIEKQKKEILARGTLVPQAVGASTGGGISAPYSNAAYSAIQEQEQEQSGNNGGPLGGLGYLAEKFALGTVQGFEGIVDYTAGGIAKLFGYDAWAERQFANDWMNYNHADEWYDPQGGWKFAGDIAGGIGSSMPGIAGAAAGAAIIAASGGALTGVGAKLVAGGLASAFAGLSAAGTATKEAYAESGELDGNAFAYGALSGATEAGLELVSAGLGKGSGRIANELAKRAGKEMTESVTKGGLKQAAKSIFEDFASEAFEEGMSEYLAPKYKRMTYDPTAKDATFGELAYAGAVGGISGMVMNGAGTGFSKASQLVSGNRAVQKGTAEGILRNSRQIAEKESAEPMGYEASKATKEIYDKLTESMKQTNGEIRTPAQKIMLGQLKYTNTAFVASIGVEKRMYQALSDLDRTVAQLKAFGAKDASGNPLTLTAEQLSEGVDMDLFAKYKDGSITKAERKTLAKSIRSSMKSNSMLTTFATMEAVGGITMDARSIAYHMAEGGDLLNEYALDQLIRNGKQTELDAVQKDLGVDLATVSAEELRQRAGEFVTSERGSEVLQMADRIKRARSASPETAERLPRGFSKDTEDGVYRFTAKEDLDLSLVKEGDKYYLYDHAEGDITRALSREEANGVLRKYWQWQGAKAKQTQATAAQAKAKTESHDISSEKERSVSRTNSKNMHDTDIAILKPLDEYPYNMQTVIEGYIDSADEKMIAFIEDARQETNKKRREWMHFSFINNISKKNLQKIKTLIGLDVKDYSVQINGESISHIDERHGVNGKQDHSMKNVKDMARMQYIIQNADDVEYVYDSKGRQVFDHQYRNGDNTPSFMLRLVKKINGTYYIAIATPNSKKKALQIKSAFISKKKEGHQELDAYSPQLTSEPNLGKPSTPSVPQTSEKSNSFEKNNLENEEVDPSTWFARGETELSKKAKEADALARKEAKSRTNSKNMHDTEGKGHKKITIDSTDHERYLALKDRKLSLSARTNTEKVEAVMKKFDITQDIFDYSAYGERTTLFRKIGTEFGLYKTYQNQDVDIVFTFSKGNMKESVRKQKKNYYKFAKLLSCFDAVIENAVGIEIHNRNAEGYKVDASLKQCFVLASAFVDGDDIVPVKLEVKEFSDKENTLYVAIALEGIKKDEIVTQGVAENGVAQQYAPSSTISIAQLFKKVNPSDKSFYKYIPKEFLAETVSEVDPSTLFARGETELSKKAKEADALARKEVKDYAKLSERNKVIVRRTILQGLAYGVDRDAVLDAARVSAHSGLRVVFDKKACYIGKNKDGKDGYADGFYDPKGNRIVINPKAKQGTEKILLHELDHAVRMFLGKDGKLHTKIFLGALQGVSQEVRDSIVTEYANVESSVSHIELLMDETNAYFAADVLSNRHTVEKLIEAKPMLADKILSFFKIAAQDYRDSADLSASAKKYYRQYKKMFDAFSERNFQNNAFDGTNPYIRMSLSLDDKEENRRVSNKADYSYDTLCKKPDMTITEVTEALPRDVEGKISRSRVRAMALANVRKQNNPKNTADLVYAHCDDTGTDIRVGINGINHGLDRRVEVNARASLVIGDLIKNAIKVNEVNSLSQGHDGDYVLLSCFSDETGVYGVSIYVDRVSNEVTGMDSIDILYSVNGKKIGTAAPNARVSDQSPSLTVPTISISQLLEKSNGKFKDIFSKDVYEHFGTEKDTSTKLGSSTRYAMQMDDLIGQKKTSTASEEKAHSIYGKEFNKLMYEDDGSLKGVPEGQRKKTKDPSKMNVKKASSNMVEHILESFHISTKDKDGHYLQVLANLKQDRVFSQQDALDVLEGSDLIHGLNKQDKNEIAKELWKIYNEGAGKKKRRGDFYDVAEYAVLKSIDNSPYPESALITSVEDIPVWIEELIQQFEVGYATKGKESAFGEKMRKKDERLQKSVAWWRERRAEDLRKKEEYFQNRIKQIRERTQAKLDEKDRAHQAMIGRWVGVRERRQMRNALYRTVKRLNRKLFQPTKENHIPADMHRIIAESLSKLNMDARAQEDLLRIQDSIEKMIRSDVRDEDAIIALYIKRDELEAKCVSLRQSTAALLEAYKKFASEGDSLARNAYDADLAVKLEELVGEIGDTPVRKMTYTQLKAANDFYTMLMHRVNESNKLFTEQKGEGVRENAVHLTEEIKKSKLPLLFRPKVLSLGITRKIREFLLNNMKPLHYADFSGSATLRKLMGKLHEGECVWAKDIYEAKKFFDALSKKYNIYSWDTKKRHEFTDKNGKKVSFTLGEMFTLYAYSRREAALGHLSQGGFKFRPNTKVEKGMLPKVLNDATRYQMDLVELGAIANALTDEQRAFAEKMQEYLSKDLASKGNEVSSALCGANLFEEEFYFPIQCSDEFLQSETGKQGDPKIKNKGMTKKTTPNANNPLILEDFFDVWFRHVNDMALYHGMVLPIEDITRVLNFVPSEDLDAVLDKKEEAPTNNGVSRPVGNAIQNTSSKDSTSNSDGKVNRNEKNKESPQENSIGDSVKQVMQEHLGSEWIAYLERLLVEINGGVRAYNTLGGLDALLTNFKRISTMASMSVMIQQPSSLPRAFSIIDAKYFVGIPKLDHIAQRWEHIQKYAGVAILKDMGGFDVGTGRTTAAYMQSKEYQGMEKVKGFFTDKDYRDNAFGSLAAKADIITWIQIWEACCREQLDIYNQSSEAKMSMETFQNSEEMMQKVAERFDYVITRTQVYDSLLSRSAHMRAKDGLSKMATAFMSEPTTIFNMLICGLGMKVRGERGCGRIFASVITAVILNNLLAAIVYAARDDDEEKSYAEKYLLSFVGNTKDSLNPLTMVPIARDIMSLLQGYDIERSDMTVISDLYRACEKMLDGKPTVNETMDFIASVGSIFGIPTRNILRDARGAYNVMYGMVHGENTTAAGMRLAFRQGLLGREITNGQQLYNAKVKGDDAQYARVEARFASTDRAISALRQALRDNDRRIEEAAMAKLQGDVSSYQTLLNEIVEEGHFTRGFVLSAINAEGKAIREDMEASGQAVFVGENMYTLTSDQFAALGAEKSRMETELLAMKQSQSYLALSEDEREDAERYAEDLIDHAAEAKVLGIYVDKKSMLTNTLGIGTVSVAYAKTKDIAADKNVQGKAIAGSKKKKVIAAILAMNISTEQKLLLICSKGYAIRDGDIRGISAKRAKQLLSKYIISLKISKEEKAELAELCGFEVKNGKIITNGEF